MENNSKPYYLKLSSTLITITLLLLLLYVGRNVLIPLFFASIFCIFLIKPCNYLERKGVHHAIAAIICMLLSIIVMGTIIYFISTQIVAFKNDLPTLSNNLNKASDNLQTYVQQHFHISYSKIHNSLQNLREKALASAPSIVGSTFATLSGIIEYLVLIPIYTFLMLLYRNLIVRFLLASFSETHSEAVAAILGKTKFVIRNYIFGLLIEMLTVAVLSFIGYMIVGSEYAILLAFLIAILNLIPYLGVLTAAIISVIITASSSNPVVIIGVLIVIAIVHLVDSNILLPKIVGSKVKINAFVTIVGVVVGSELWGIPGMFLAVPMMAILKVLFDGVEELKPWGILLGEDLERPTKQERKILRIKIKKTNEKNND